MAATRGAVAAAALFLLAAAGPLTPSCAHGPAGGAAQTPGERLVAAKCGACHLRPRPHSVDPAKVDRLLGAHASRVPLSLEQREAISRFLSE